MSDPTPLRIDPERCRAVAETIARLPRGGERALPTLPPEASPSAQVLHWLVATGICQRTGCLDGAIEGQALRGSDYLFAALRRDLRERPERWTAEALGGWTIPELQAVVSDTGRAEDSTLDRLEERIAQVNDLGRVLVERWGGDACRMFDETDGSVAGSLAALAHLLAYEDPVEKKSHLLLITLHEAGLWRVSDPEHLEIAVDYHVMRVALRTGMVEVINPLLAEALRAGRPVEEDVDTAVRLAVRDACKAALASAEDLTPFHLDHVLWMVGRNCCRGDEPPVCTEHGRCWKSDTCSLIVSLDLDCGLECPLSGACAGFEDPERRALRETAFETARY